MTFRLEILPAAEWADRVAADLAARLRAEPRLRLCLPTGDTPSPVYARLAALAQAGRAPFDSAVIVALDEYLELAPGHPARCDVRLQRELLDLLPAPPASFHRIEADDPDPAAAAARIDAVAADGLDLALLGLGANGHVGLNEPGSYADAPTRVVRTSESSRRAAAERYGADPAPTAAITLGMRRLLEAREVWLLVTGERKASILARALEAPEGPDCPATWLRRHPDLRVIADEPAAAGLRRRA
jgi:6-phosphogluconolactonase/glucosamine-6-phosphate isomerase/deaminase